MYAPQMPYPYAYPPPYMGRHVQSDDNKKQMMLGVLVLAGCGFWYFKSNYKSPQEMIKHMTGKLDKITLADIAKSGASQFVKYKLGTTGKIIWVAKKLVPIVKPQIDVHLPTDPLPEDFLDTGGDTYSYVSTSDPNEYIVLKNI
tara:strand:+ start:1309 stop:1740 length:432 start_codon:yes stop_codon:yes gene_type:complete